MSRRLALVVALAVALAFALALVAQCGRGGGADMPGAGVPDLTDDETRAGRKRAGQDAGDAASAPDARTGTAGLSPSDSSPPRPEPQLVPLPVLVLSDADDTPIAGARVTEGGRWVADGLSDWQRTDAAGRVTLSVVADPLGHDVTVDAEGFARVTRRRAAGASTARPASEADPFVVRLPRGGTVEGEAFGDSGAPAAGAMVELLDAREMTVRLSLCDSEGRFRIGSVPVPGSWRVGFHRSGFAESFGSRLVVGPETLPVATVTPEQPTAHVTLRARPAARLALRAISPDGTPCAHWGVEAWGPGGSRRWRGFRDVQRGFTLTVEPGAWRFIVTSETGIADPLELTLAPADVVERTVQLTGGVAIEGLVVDARGAPVPRARVIVRRVNPVDPEGFRTVVWGDGELVTGPDGRFRAPRLLPGLHTGTVLRDDLPATDFRADAPSGDVRVVLPDWARVRFRLRAPEGAVVIEPLPVTAYVPQADGTSGGWAVEAAREGGGAWVVRCPPGTNRLDFRVEGTLGAQVAVTTRSSEETDAGEVVLDAGVALRGRVLDEDGRPVHEASVVAWSATRDGELLGQSDGLAGVFEIRSLPREDTILDVRAEGRVGALVRVASPAPDGVEIRLARGALVSGRVVDSTGTPVVRAFVSGVPGVPESGQGAMGGWIETDESGTFVVRAPVGRARIVARTRSGERGAEDVQVEPDGARGVIVRVGR